MEYEITAKPSTLGNPMSNAVLGKIHQFLINLVWTFNISTQTYFDENYPWIGILAAAEFVIRSTTDRQNNYIPAN